MDDLSKKDIETLKIQIYSERVHTRYSTTISTSFAIFIGFIVILYTLLHDNAWALSLAVGVLTAGTLYEIYRIRAAYNAGFIMISNMIRIVQEGRELPSLEDLDRVQVT